MSLEAKDISMKLHRNRYGPTVQINHTGIRLTLTELMVLRLTHEGLSNEEIGDELDIAPDTTHVFLSYARRRNKMKWHELLNGVLSRGMLETKFITRAIDLADPPKTPIPVR